MTIRALQSRKKGRINFKKLSSLINYDYFVLLSILIYSLSFSYYNILKHYSFRSFAWDLGIITQSLSSVLKGHFFINNVEMYYSSSRSYFGVHFSPIYFIVVPIFALYPKVEIILILQVLILALSVIPVYCLAKVELEDKRTAFLLSVSYLLNPSLQGMSWYHFPPQTFLPLCILTATYFLKMNKKSLFFVFILLSLMTSEQSTFFILLYLIYVFWNFRYDIINFLRYRKFNFNFFFLISVFLTCIIWFILSELIKYFFNPNPPVELKALGAFKYLQINNIFEIPYKLITSPNRVLEAIRYGFIKKMLYILLTFGPGGFISFLSPLPLIPCFWWLLVSLVSNHDPYFELGFHYPAYTLPFIMIGEIEGIKKISSLMDTSKMKKIAYKISILILLISILLISLTSPLSIVHVPGDFTYFRDYGITYPSSINFDILNILNEIPENSYILTTPTIFPAIANYLNAYTVPPINAPSQRIFLGHLNYLKSLNFDYIFFTYLWDKSISDLIYKEFIIGNKNYGLFLRGPGVELYKRGYNGNPRNISLKFSYKELHFRDSLIVDDHTSYSGKIIYLEPSERLNRVAWYGPYITLTKGDYIAKFRVKIDNIKEGKIIKFDVWSNEMNIRLGFLDVHGSDFERPLTWRTFSVPFSISDRMKNIEFRGLEVESNIGVYLDFIEVIVVEGSSI